VRATQGVIACALSLAACDGSSGNHPPSMEPVSLTVEEDRSLRFSLSARDEDGDDLELTFVESGGIELDIVRVVQTTQHGLTLLEVELQLVPDRNVFGQSGILVYISDGRDRVDAYHPVMIVPVNDRPIGVSDSFAASPNTPLSIFHSTLLANDYEATEVYNEEDPLSITEVRPLLHGTVSLGADTVTFVPETNFVGTATFEYTVSDGDKTHEATVWVAVGAPNAPPTAVDDRPSPLSFVFEPPTLTSNDVDADGQTLAVIAVANPTHGTVQVSNGVVTFTPEPDYFGNVTFDYTVTDGVATDVGHVELPVPTGE
jgi:hypothetical protein